MVKQNFDLLEFIDLEYIYSSFGNDVKLLKKVYIKTKQLIPLDLNNINLKINEKNLKDIKFLSHKIIGPLRIFFKEESLIMINLFELENIMEFDEKKIKGYYNNVCKIFELGFDYLKKELELKFEEKF